MHGVSVVLINQETKCHASRETHYHIVQIRSQYSTHGRFPCKSVSNQFVICHLNNMPIIDVSGWEIIYHASDDIDGMSLQ